MRFLLIFGMIMIILLSLLWLALCLYLWNIKAKSFFDFLLFVFIIASVFYMTYRIICSFFS